MPRYSRLLESGESKSYRFDIRDKISRMYMVKRRILRYIQGKWNVAESFIFEKLSRVSEFDDESELLPDSKH